MFLLQAQFDRFFLNFDDGHCDRIHSTLTSDPCFDNDFGGKEASGLGRILYHVLGEKKSKTVIIGALASTIICNNVENSINSKSTQ